MTDPVNGNSIELKRIVRMLEVTVEMAQDAEMTGSLAEKSAAAVRSYNTTVNHLISTGQIPAALFAPLPADANLTDVAMSSAQLAEYLRAGLPEEERSDGGPNIERNFHIGVLQLGGQDKDELSQMIRDHLSEYFGAPKEKEGSEEAERASAEPSAAAPPSPPPAGGSRRAALPSQARVEEMHAEGQAGEARRQ